MATYTEKLNLKKPAQADFYNVDDFNENFQKIDTFAGRKDNPHDVTPEQIGAVQRTAWVWATNPTDRLYDYIKSKIDMGYTQGVIQVDASKGVADIPDDVRYTLGSYFLCVFQRHYYEYMRAVLYSDGSLYEYTNMGVISKDGNWATNWTEKMCPRGYLPVSGGTLDGNLTIDRDWATITMTDESGRMAFFEKHPSANHLSLNTYKDSDNYNSFVLSPETYPVLDGVVFKNTVNGVVKNYRMMHEGNFSDLAPTLGMARIKYGTYVGSGTSGSANPNILTSDFDIKFVLVYYSDSLLLTGEKCLIAAKGIETTYTIFGDINRETHLTWNEQTFKWYHSLNDFSEEFRAMYQLNSQGVTYHYILIG